MTTFVDTSALLAVINQSDPDHERAAGVWSALVSAASRLRTHSYVVVEVSALVQRRHGMDAARVLHDDILPAVSIRFVDQLLHDRSVATLLAANRRGVSLVDWASFELMREEGLSEAFAFDDDFAAAGFTVVPG